MGNLKIKDMPSNISTKSRNWPISQFRFTVQFGDKNDGVFEEVKGLNHVSPMPMPGQSDFITMKRVAFKNSKKFLHWYYRFQEGTIISTNIAINYLDNKGNPEETWTLCDAKPIEISGVSTTPGEEEFLVKKIVVRCESITRTGS